MSQKDALRRVQEQFGKNAEKYVSSVGHAQGVDLARLVECVVPARHEVALDVATGGGHVARSLAPLVKTVVVTDITVRMLETARSFLTQNGVSNAQYVLADAENLPFLGESFDIVTCRIAAHHFPNPEAFIREVWRVLKPGGRFVLIDNVAPDDLQLADFMNLVEQIRDPSHARCLSAREWTETLEDAGFRVMSDSLRKKTHPFLPWLNRMAPTEAHKFAVISMLKNASKMVADYFQIELDDASVVGFSADEWFCLAHKQKDLGASAEDKAVADFGYIGVDHVQLAAPQGCEKLARKFFGEQLGWSEIPKPETLKDRGGVWFQCGAHQVHIGIAQNFVPATKAHPAFEVTDIHGLRKRLEKHGVVMVEDDKQIVGVQRFFVNDPFGNRLEFLERR